MNVKRSIEVALAKKGVKKIDLALHLETTPQQISNWCRKNSLTCNSLERLAGYFDLKLSEFIALGEE